MPSKVGDVFGSQGLSKKGHGLYLINFIIMAYHFGLSFIDSSFDHVFFGTSLEQNQVMKC